VVSGKVSYLRNVFLHVNFAYLAARNLHQTTWHVVCEHCSQTRVATGYPHRNVLYLNSSWTRSQLLLTGLCEVFSAVAPKPLDWYIGLGLMKWNPLLVAGLY